MKKTVLVKLTACILILVIALSGCAKSESKPTSDTAKDSSSKETIKIGTSFPMTGTVAADGNYIVDAIKLAADQCNEAGGINGRKIEIVSEDDEANPTTAASVGNKFAENSDIMAVITSYNSSCALAQIPIYKDAKLTAISPVSTNPDITGMSPYFYRTCNNDGYVGAMCADFCKELGFKKVAVLYEMDDYGYGILEKFKGRAAEIGMEIATEQSFVYGETKDFSTIVTSVKDSGADGIFFAGLVTEMALFANQAETQGLALPTVAGEGCNSPAMITEGGQAVEGVYTVGAFSSESDAPLVKKFVEDFKGKYNEEPSVWAALAYDAANVVFEAMKSCETLDRESINKAMSSIEYEGVTGMNKFKDSDVAKEYLKFQIKDGKIQLMK